MNHAPVAADFVLGGWTVSGSLRYTSGNAMQINAFNFFASTLGYNTSVLGLPFEFANYVGGNPHGTWSGKFNPKRPNTAFGDSYLNASAFSSPAPFTFGNTAPYLSWVRGFTQGSEALEIQKTISIRERLKFDFGADFVNPFNIVRWANPSTLVGTPTFGTVSGTQGTPRQIQINGKINF
jgi:hypothetical protein